MDLRCKPRVAAVLSAKKGNFRKLRVVINDYEIIFCLCHDVSAIVYAGAVRNVMCNHRLSGILWSLA